MSTRPTKHLITVGEYEQMAVAGIFHEDDRLELLEGEIVDMNPIGSTHASVVARVAAGLHEKLGRGAVIRVQDPVRLGELSEPQPDLAVVAPRDDFYVHAHPGPSDIWLIIEVADTSGAFDRDIKIPTYARWSIPEAILIDLPNRAIEIYGSPGPSGYSEKTLLGKGDSFTAVAVSGLSISYEDVFGP